MPQIFYDRMIKRLAFLLPARKSEAKLSQVWEGLLYFAADEFRDMEIVARIIHP
jgi:hypothetical protein